MPIISSIIQHSNPYAATVNSDTIRGGFRTAQATAAALANLFDNNAAPGSSGNELDLVKQHATITYVTADDKYYILDDYSAADIAPGTAGSGWIDFRVAIGAASADGAVSLDATIDANLLDVTAGELSLHTQTANAVFAGPSSGSAAEPSFRSLVAADLPNDVVYDADISTALFDADFATQGIMATDGAGNYSIVTNNSSNWDTAYGWGNHALEGYLVSSDISSLISSIGVSEGSNGTAYKLVLTDESATGSYTTTYIDSSDLTFTPGSGTNAGVLGVGGLSVAGNATISGNLTVVGDVVQTSSETVVFNDTFLDLNVANSASTYQTDSGFRFARATSAANTISQNAAFTYDASEDLFKFTRHTDSSTGSVNNADNVLALKFGVTTSGLGTEAATSNDVADLYNTNANARSNNTNVRSLGGVSKCTINITTESTDGASNFAPVAAAANGYPIQHDLNTTSVFVVALQTKDNTGTAISEPQPVYVKYKVLSADVVEVKVGITQENEEYDIIVIG